MTRFVSKQESHKQGPVPFCRGSRYLSRRRSITWPLLVAVRLRDMANPQLEDGFLRIANEVWDALIAIRIPGRARQILDLIIRKTWGFQKKSDYIALSQFVNATGISKRELSREFVKLRQMNLISQKADDNGVNYSFNKNYDTWKPSARKLTSARKLINISQIADSRQPDSYQTSARKPHSKDTIKDTSSKDTTKDMSGKPDDIPYSEIISDLNQLLHTNYSDQTEDYRKKIRARWKEGYRFKDFQIVHDKKYRQWIGSDMAKHLCPATLYAKSHFDSYLNQPESLEPLLSKQGQLTVQAGKIWERMKDEQESGQSQVPAIDEPID